MTIFKVIAAILSIAMAVMIYMLPTTNDSLSGVFTSADLTQSKRDSLFSKLSLLACCLLIASWAASCYLAINH